MDRLCKCCECSFSDPETVDVLTGKPFCQNWKQYLDCGCFYGVSRKQRHERGELNMICDHCIQRYEMDCDYKRLRPSPDGLCRGFLLDYAGLSPDQKRQIQTVLKTSEPIEEATT